MRILIVDDHQVVRRGIRSILEEEESFDVCGEATSGRDAIDQAIAVKPDAIVMDISMPNLDGIEATRRIADLLPNVKIVILSQHDVPHIMRQAINAGASAYVVKSAISTELIPALNGPDRREWRGSAVFGSTQTDANVREILRRSAALEVALRESEERFRLTFEQAAVGMAHVAENGRWLRVNQKLCDILGYTEGELLRLRIQDLSYPGERASDSELLERLAKREINQYATEKRCVRKDGNTIWCEVYMTSVYTPEGQFKHFLRVKQDVTARKQAEQQLAKEVSDLKLLQEISTHLIGEQNSQALYELIADAAVAIMESDFASMQLLDFQPGQPGELVLLAYRGFTPEAAHFWQRVLANSGSTCAAALRTGKRVIARDIETSDVVCGEDLAVYRQTGIRAVQTTPLLSRTGALVGMISTHWHNVHSPTERDLRMFDVLARQAADLIERRQEPKTSDRHTQPPRRGAIQTGTV